MSKPKLSSELDVPIEILFELLTESEVKMVQNRWKIVALLKQKLAIRRIASEAGVGTDTVIRMSKVLKANSKISKFVTEHPQSVRIQVDPIRRGSKWIFGSSKE